MPRGDDGQSARQVATTWFKRITQAFASRGLKHKPRFNDVTSRPPGIPHYDPIRETIYLALPKPGSDEEITMYKGLGFHNGSEFEQFLRLGLPPIIAHELGHYYRMHPFDTFNSRDIDGLLDPGNRWKEEQIANRLASAVARLSLSVKERKMLQKMLEKVCGTLCSDNGDSSYALAAFDSMFDILHFKEKVSTHDFENLELARDILGKTELDLLTNSGGYSQKAQFLLDTRKSAIKAVEQAIREISGNPDVSLLAILNYNYFHTMWMRIYLNSRESSYIDEFIVEQLERRPKLLYLPEENKIPTSKQIKACFGAYRTLRTGQNGSPLAIRYFYKRYRSLLIAKLEESIRKSNLENVEELVEQLHPILASWDGDDHTTDSVSLLGTLVSKDMQSLFPESLEKGQNNTGIKLPDELPTDIDKALYTADWNKAGSGAAANTIGRLKQLEALEVFRSLPPKAMIELAGKTFEVSLKRGEYLCRAEDGNDDVFFLLEGHLERLVYKNDVETKVADIKNSGEMVGEIPFFVERQRYFSIRAADNSKCLVLKDTELHRLAFKHPEILMRMGAVLANRVLFRMKNDDGVV